MSRRIVALTAAFIVLSVGYLAGFYFFGHLFAPEAGTGRPPVPFFAAFAISNVLLVGFFAWVAHQMGHAVKAGLTIAISQALLVNVFYVMTGSRSVAAGAASILISLVTWTCVASTYQALLGRPRSMNAQVEVRSL